MLPFREGHLTVRTLSFSLKIVEDRLFVEIPTNYRVAAKMRTDGTNLEQKKRGKLPIIAMFFVALYIKFYRIEKKCWIDVLRKNTPN